MARNVRLTRPLIRRDGAHAEASWEEALAIAAAGFTAVKTQYGGNALGLMSCSKATNETNYLAQKFARTVLDTNNIDSCNRT